MKKCLFAAALLLQFGAFAQTHTTKEALLADPNITRIVQWQSPIPDSDGIFVKNNQKNPDKGRFLLETVLTEAFLSKNTLYTNEEGTQTISYADWKRKFPNLSELGDLQLWRQHLVSYNQRENSIFLFEEMAGVYFTNKDGFAEGIVWFRIENATAPLNEKNPDFAWIYRMSSNVLVGDNVRVKTLEDDPNYERTVFSPFFEQLALRADTETLFYDPKLTKRLTPQEIRNLQKGTQEVTDRRGKTHQVERTYIEPNASFARIEQDWYFNSKTQRLGAVTRSFAPTYSKDFGGEENWQEIVPFYKPVYKSLIPKKK